MAPKPFQGDSPGDGALSPEERAVDGALQDEKKQEATEARKSIPLSLVVLGIFGQAGDETTEDIPMLRYRLNTTDPDAEDYDPGLFTPIEGLTSDDGPHEFYHNDLSDDETEEDKIGDRAILFQSIENYERVAREPTLASHFHLHDKLAYAGNDHRPLSLTDEILFKERVLSDTRFGEQVIIEGATPADISVGDIFEVADGRSPLKVQVTSPRKPCWWLDAKNKTAKGLKGIKGYSAHTGLAGWFTSVLVAGELQDGMKLVRTHHPYPKWTLEEISHAIYGGEGDFRARIRGHASWNRSREELKELLDMDILCDEEWKDEVKDLMEKLDAMEKQQKEAEQKQKEQEGLLMNSIDPLGLVDSMFTSLYELMDSMCGWSNMGCCLDEALEAAHLDTATA